MSSKSSKSGRKEAMTPLDETLVALGKLRDEILKEFKTAFKQLEDKLDRINDKVDKHAEHLSRINSTSEDLESRVRYLETLCSSLEEKCNKLLSKMVDLENHSRRCNLRILGLPEATEQGSTVKLFAEFLCEIFGKDLLLNPPKLERAHRVYIPPGILGSRPRPVILCFHQYQVKHSLIVEARRRGSLPFQDTTIRFVEDFAPQTLKMRAEFKGVMKVLFDCGFKPSLRNPADLRIKLNTGKYKWFKSVKEAEAFVASLPAIQPSSESDRTS